MNDDHLRAQIREKERQLSSYTKRRNSIKSIIYNIDSKFDDHVRDINKQISNCINDLTAGLKGCGITKTISTDMRNFIQKYSGSDSKISSARSNLSSEVSRCEDEINSLYWEISNLENQIRDER